MKLKNLLIQMRTDLQEKLKRSFERVEEVYLGAIILLSISMPILTGCEKAVSFSLDEEAPKLVIEASIENSRPPVVIISKSLNYFSQISADILAKSFVHGAEVYISNGSLMHKLKEYSVPVSGGFILYYYSIDSSDLSTAFTGEVNTTYTMLMKYDGKEYTAKTLIPNITRRIDSLWWIEAPGNNQKVKLMGIITDPPGFGDYIRYFTKTNSEPFYPGFNSVFNDHIIDGTTYEVEVERGVDRNKSLEDEFTLFNKGDTVIFKLCNIDKATFDFWRTMEFSYANIGNPFSTPTKVVGNITNNALGYFGGYACQYRTIIIPK